MSTGYINFTENFIDVPHIIADLLEFIGSPFIFSILLLLYFFAVSKTKKIEQRKYKWVLIPVVGSFLLRVFMCVFEGSNETILEEIDSVFAILEILFAMGIDLLILILIKRHNKTILNYFSSLKKKQLNWLKIIIIINLGFFVIWIVDDGLNALIGGNIVSLIISEISLYATLINVLWIGFSSLRQPPIFTDIEPVELSDYSNESPEKSFNNDDMQLFESINERLKKEKHYLNSSLTLGELSCAMEIRDKELSRIINSCSQDSFYSYINTLRVEHFKSILSDNEYANLSILGMAMESGFKNKSTFYAAFRKVEGMTPKEYQSNLNS
jgi:AraC-like DNA-binding protein